MGQQAQPAHSQHDVDAEFLNSLLSALQDIVLTRLEGKVALESVSMEKARIRIDGVQLRNAKIGLILKNDSAKRLSGALLKRYAASPDPPAWTKALRVASLGIYNDLEISLSLRELSVRRLNVDADDLRLEGLSLRAFAGSDTESTSEAPVAPASQDVLESIFQVLRRAAISRAEAHLRLDNLAAKRLRLELEGANLEGLSVAVTLRRAHGQN